MLAPRTLLFSWSPRFFLRLLCLYDPAPAYLIYSIFINYCRSQKNRIRLSYPALAFHFLFFIYFCLTKQHFSQIGDHSRRFLSFRKYDKRQKSCCHSPQDHYSNRYDLLCYCHSHSFSLLSGYVSTVMPDILLTSVYVLFFSSPHASSFPGSIK